ncbi:ataxin-7-like protein 3 [Trichogramma pretiosum]|uniref:ataxin-7-like protein 3 n=1 Tax=Trichogramma pretiosum TaxID=7493 RepID=UPI0006C9D12D|nr:ataxin-7-like protein 3 [Trichogramma pretiosum]
MENLGQLNDEPYLDKLIDLKSLDSVACENFEDLMAEVTMGFVFDMHRQHKSGQTECEEGIADEGPYTVVDVPGLDVFGQPLTRKSPDCSCPNCDRTVSASRFATHLEKCMGMGRNSSRIASRRIANSSKDLSTYQGLASDDEDDADWNANTEKRNKRRKERNGVKKVKKTSRVSTPTLKNGGGSGVGGGGAGGSSTVTKSGSSSRENSPTTFEAMSIEDKRNLLSQICGVVSEHTKKLCTRTMRCPQHSEDQRREMRASVEAKYSNGGGSGSSKDPGMHVDIDGFEEADSRHIRESLTRWEQEGSNHSSPADSASTTSSSSRKTKKGKHKQQRVSPTGMHE